MATFPPLAPSTRAYTPGEYPHTAYTSMSGEQSRVRHSTVVLNSRLELTYERLSQNDRQAIETHYHGQQGEFVAFTLSPQVFSGFVPLEVDPAGQWRYAEPPEVEDFCGPTANVKVVLVSVPGNAPGAQNDSIDVSFIGGEGYRSANGIARTVTVSFTAGAATSGTPSGPLLLLHMEGTGSTFVDSSAYSRTVTAYGDATQATSPVKFGSKAAKFVDGTGLLQISSLGITGDFTLEMWFYLAALPATGSRTLVNLGVSSVAITSDGYLDGPYYTAVSTSAWHYLKISRQSGDVRRFLDGVQVCYDDGEFLECEVFSNGTVSTLYVARGFTSGTLGLNCSIDELRITAEADNSLTVPTAAFPDP